MPGYKLLKEAILDDKVSRGAHCGGKALVLSVLLFCLGLGFAAVHSLQLSRYEEPATAMAALPSAISPATRARLPLPPRAGHFMQPLPRQPVQPLRAVKSPNGPNGPAFPVTAPESQLETTKGRREMFVKLAAALGLATAAADKAALADEGEGKRDGQLAMLGWPPVIALGLVGSNIIVPFLKQLDDMEAEQERKEAQAVVRSAGTDTRGFFTSRGGDLRG